MTLRGGRSGLYGGTTTNVDGFYEASHTNRHFLKITTLRQGQSNLATTNKILEDIRRSSVVPKGEKQLCPYTRIAVGDEVLPHSDI